MKRNQSRSRSRNRRKSRQASQASRSSRSREASKASSRPPSRRRDDDSLEHSDETPHISSDVESPTVFTVPNSQPEYASLYHSLRTLRHDKKDILRFLEMRSQIAMSGRRPPPLDHLQQLNCEVFWKQSIPLMLRKVIESRLQSVSILKSDKSGIVTLNRQEVFVLLSHMFFGTLTAPRHCDIAHFFYLFTSEPKSRSEPRLQKLKCLIHYFNECTKMTQQQWRHNIIYQRINQEPKTIENHKLSIVKITKTNIEQNEGELMVDFANMIIGGGVLKNGCVQQEIMFVTCPELIITKLIFEILQPNDAIVVHGWWQYSNYEGYSDSFKWKGDRKRNSMQDVYGKTQNSVIAIDALDFSCFVSTELQYEKSFIMREIHKAYVGFSIKQWIDGDKAIVTGKWGCGAFRGDPQMKFLIQWIVCSWVGRKYVFVNWGQDKNDEYEEIVTILNGKRTNEVLKLLENYQAERNSKKVSLFEYIKTV